MRRKQIERHPNYIVDDLGFVYRDRCGIAFELRPDVSNGYPRVDLDGVKEYVARLVLEAFDPQPDPCMRVFYIDGDRSNTKLSNLIWLTPSEIQMFSQYTIEYREYLLYNRLKGR